MGIKVADEIQCRQEQNDALGKSGAIYTIMASE